MKRRARKLVKNVFDILWQPEMLVLPGQLAFFFILSVVPLLTLISYGATAINLDTNIITDFISLEFGKNIADLISPTITTTSISLTSIITILIGFFIASNGAASMIVTSNAIYGIKDRGFIRRRVKAVIMTFFIVFLFTFILIFPLFGTTIINILDLLTKSSITSKIQFIINILRGPLSWLIIFVIIKILYSMAPDENIPSSQTTYGALFTSIGWIISTFIYSFYINNIAQYQVFYGGLTNIIILMLWVYLLAYIFTIGMALNYKNKEERD